MPAPSNDAPAAEPVLFSQLSSPVGSLAWSNIGATPDAVANEGADIHSVWWTCYLVARRPVFISTRVYAADPAGSRTNFDTVISLFSSLNANTPGTLIATNDNYANWSRESCLELPYGIITSGYYFIRVHGKAGAEGNFIIRWGGSLKRLLTRKPYVRARDGLIFVAGLRQPSVDVGPTSTPFVSADYGSNHPPGEYVARYENGAWRYGDGRVPNPQNLSDWVVTRFYGRNFLKIGYRANGTASQASLTGYNVPQGSFDDARRNALFLTPTVSGPSYRTNAYLVHSGGLITLDFDDDQYTDNVPGSPLPGVLLYRVAPQFEVVPPPTFGVVTRFADAGVVFTLRNLGHNAFTGVKVELLEYGGITSPSPSYVTLGIFGSQTAALSPFSYQLTQPGETRLTARLRISDRYGNAAQTIDVDFSPDLKKDGEVVVEPVGASGPPWRARFPIRNRGLGPTRDLRAVITPTGMTNATGLTQTIGVLAPRTSRYLDVEFDTPSGQPFSAEILLMDGPVTYAPLTYAATAV